MIDIAYSEANTVVSATVPRTCLGLHYSYVFSMCLVLIIVSIVVQQLVFSCYFLLMVICVVFNSITFLNIMLYSFVKQCFMHFM